MIHRADKYLAQQHGRELDWAPGLMPAVPVFPDRTAMHWMTTIQRGSPQNLSMTLRRPIPRSLKMTPKRMRPTHPWVLIHLTD